MKQILKYLFYFILFTTLGFAEEKKDWSYANIQQWANLSEINLGCKEGKQQSPINIKSKSVKPGAQDFKIDYKPAKGVNITLDHATFKIAYPQGSYLHMGGKKYSLKEIHFKTPAENGVDSVFAPLEAQFFNEDSKGEKIILSVRFTDFKANPVIETLINNFPQEGKSIFITNVDANKLLPNNFSSYQFYGSLPFPPCTQNVYWIVLKQTMTVTQSEVEAMQAITGVNARKAQDVFDRLITE